MNGQQFEIKVALLGYVSVGKTTVLNAIFRDKFGEVSMRRTTAGINFFRIVRPDSEKDKNRNGSHQKPPSPDQANQATRTAQDVLKQIESANRELREAQKIEEKWFNIELDEELCTMRNDTTLVIVDIPGINEAQTESIYTDYVNKSWKEFDCVVAVMDARQGVNTKEQVDLLKLIKKNLASQKDVPVIILFNKVDEPDDSEQTILMHEARQKVSEVFNVGCRESSLHHVLRSAGSTNVPRDVYPVVIATSAIHAFFYRAASLLTYEQFKQKFSKEEIIERIGKEECGRFHWKRLSSEEKCKAVFRAVREASNYQERLEATNFDKFLSVLSLTVSGSVVQIRLLQKQLDVKILALPRDEAILAVLRYIYERCLVLAKDMSSLKAAFWAAYKNEKETALNLFESEVKVDYLAKPLEMLWDYFLFARSVGWDEEEQNVVTESCDLFRRQLGVIVNSQCLAASQEALRPQTGGFVSAPGRPDNCARAFGWATLSPYDWLSIIESILLMSCSKTFCETFGREKIMLVQRSYQFASTLSFPGICQCANCNPNQPKRSRTQYYSPSCKKSACQHHWNVRFYDGGFRHCGQNELINIGIPAMLSDQSHWGHVAWKCCKLLEAVKNDKQTDLH